MLEVYSRNFNQTPDVEGYYHTVVLLKLINLNNAERVISFDFVETQILDLIKLSYYYINVQIKGDTCIIITQMFEFYLNCISYECFINFAIYVKSIYLLFGIVIHVVNPEVFKWVYHQEPLQHKCTEQHVGL